MPHAHAPQECCATDFGAKAELYTHPAFRDLERAVLGSDYGGTSWTTLAQAEALPGDLHLDAGAHLLEVGSGSGWPAVYLAGQAHCRLTLLDLPLNALALARKRAREENVSGPVHCVSADGSSLPFPAACFDAISHSDVLCCLPDKAGMLSECHRVVRNGGHMVFTVIAPAAGLEGEAHARAIEIGPPFVDLDGDYRELVTTSGWRLTEVEDLTGEYGAALERMVAELSRDAGRYAGIMGQAAFDDELAARRRQVNAVREGLLVRERYACSSA